LKTWGLRSIFGKKNALAKILIFGHKNQQKQNTKTLKGTPKENMKSIKAKILLRARLSPPTF